MADNRERETPNAEEQCTRRRRNEKKMEVTNGYEALELSQSEKRCE